MRLFLSQGEGIQLLAAGLPFRVEPAGIPADAVALVLGLLEREHRGGQRLLRAFTFTPRRVQLCGELVGLCGHRVQIGGAVFRLPGDARKVGAKLADILVKLGDRVPHGGQPFLVFFQLCLGGRLPLTVAHDGDLLLLELVARFLQLRERFFPLRLKLPDGCHRLLQRGAFILKLLFQFADNAIAPQQVLRSLAGAAAGHAAACVQYVSRQRHHPKLPLARPHDVHAAVQILGDHRAPEQGFYHAAICFGIRAQLARDADAALDRERLALRRGQRPGLHRRYGQEGRAPEPVSPQVFDQRLGGLLRIGDDVLRRRAQRHVKRGFIVAGHVDELGDYVVHAAKVSLLRAGQRLFHRRLIAFVVLVELLERFDAHLQRAGLLRKLRRGGFLLLGLRPALLRRGGKLVHRGLPLLEQLLFARKVFLRLGKRVPDGGFLFTLRGKRTRKLRPARLHLR